MVNKALSSLVLLGGLVLAGQRMVVNTEEGTFSYPVHSIDSIVFITDDQLPDFEGAWKLVHTIVTRDTGYFDSTGTHVYVQQSCDTTLHNNVDSIALRIFSNSDQIRVQSINGVTDTLFTVQFRVEDDRIHYTSEDHEIPSERFNYYGDSFTTSSGWLSTYSHVSTENYFVRFNGEY